MKDISTESKAIPIWVKMYTNRRSIKQNITYKGFELMFVWIGGILFLSRKATTFKINDLAFFFLVGLCPYILMQLISSTYIRLQELTESVNKISLRDIIVYNLIAVVMHILFTVFLGNYLFT